MRGSQYKDKEGVEMFLGKSYNNASFALSEVALTRGFTVFIFCLIFQETSRQRWILTLLLSL